MNFTVIDGNVLSFELVSPFLFIYLEDGNSMEMGRVESSSSSSSSNNNISKNSNNNNNSNSSSSSSSSSTFVP